MSQPSNPLPATAPRVEACEACIESCMRSADVASRVECIARCRDCADACSLLERLTARGSPLVEEARRLCDAACRACREKCERVGCTTCGAC